MGLSRLLARVAARRLHVLLVEGDDEAFALRAAAERACRARGWVLALSPADADVLLTCRPQPGLVSDASDVVFDQLPGPRARGELWHERHLDAVLDELHAAYLRGPVPAGAGRRPHGHGSDHPTTSADLAGPAGHQPEPGPTEPVPAPAASAPGPAPLGVEHRHPGGPSLADSDAPATHMAVAGQQPEGERLAHHTQTDDEHASNDGQLTFHGTPGSRTGPSPAGDPDDQPSGHAMHAMHAAHEGHEDPGHEGHEGHEGPGHDLAAGHGMDMAGPGGIALASGARDRDGLEMDRLHVQLGPVLVGWPAGLVVWCTLAGDVVTQVDIVRPAFERPRSSGGDYLLAARLDAAAQLLGLAGAAASAAHVRAARDAMLVRGRRGAAVAQLLDQVPRLVDRTPLLRWSLRGLGPVSSSGAVEHGWPGSWVGDVCTRLRRLLDPLAPLDAGLVQGSVLADALPVLLTGLDVAAARLVVASLVGHVADRVPAPLQAVG